MKFSLCFVINAINGLMFNELSFYKKRLHLLKSSLLILNSELRTLTLIADFQLSVFNFQLKLRRSNYILFNCYGVIDTSLQL